MSGEVEVNRAKIDHHVKQMEKTVESLEDNIKISNIADNQMARTLQKDQIKYQGLSTQLEEARKENRQLLNILQQKTEDDDMMRTNSQGDVRQSCSTTSIVHLQYKYEELLANHRGLLRLLDTKSEEMKKIHEENIQLKLEMDEHRKTATENEDKYQKLLEKFRRLKNRKNERINKMRLQRETLEMAHNQLIEVLSNQWLDQNTLILDEIKSCRNPDRALLLQEMRKNHLLTYENFHLRQKVEFLKTQIRAQRTQKLD